VYLASNQDGERRVLVTQDGTVTLDAKSGAGQIGAAGA
jgi:hypothetical protein